MVKTQNLVPEIYYKQSRDFQALGRVYDVIFNYLKTNINTIYNNPLSENVDERLLDLVATTLGFKSKHKYNVKQLMALCSAFSSVLKIKGTKKSFEIAINALLQAEGISYSSQVLMDTNDPYKVVVYIPDSLTDITLFNDLLTYILPAGISCNVTRSQLVSTVRTTEVKSTSTINKETATSGTKTVVSNSSNFGESGDTTTGLKAGVLDNGVVVPFESGE